MNLLVSECGQPREKWNQTINFSSLPNGKKRLILISLRGAAGPQGNSPALQSSIIDDWWSCCSIGVWWDDWIGLSLASLVGYGRSSANGSAKRKQTKTGNQSMNSIKRAAQLIQREWNEWSKVRDELEWKLAKVWMELTRHAAEWVKWRPKQLTLRGKLLNSLQLSSPAQARWRAGMKLKERRIEKIL